MRVALTPALSSASCLFVSQVPLCPVSLQAAPHGDREPCAWLQLFLDHRGGLLGCRPRPTYTLSVPQAGSHACLQEFPLFEKMPSFLTDCFFNLKIRPLKLCQSGETQVQQQSRPCDIKEGSRDWSFPVQAATVSDVTKPQHLKMLLEKRLGLGSENPGLFLAPKLHSEASPRLRLNS